MAIVQASLAEELLSRQEKAVLRGIYRASQLCDAMKILENVRTTVIGDSGPVKGQPLFTDVERLQDYIRKAICTALAATKSPASHPENPTPLSLGQNA